MLEDRIAKVVAKYLPDIITDLRKAVSQEFHGAVSKACSAIEKQDVPKAVAAKVIGKKKTKKSKLKTRTISKRPKKRS